MKTFAWCFLLLGAAAVVAVAGGLPTTVVVEAEAPAVDRTFSLIETDQEITCEEDLLAFLASDSVEFKAMCGGQCGDGYCICSGSDSCCDDLCSFGCSLCENPPCVVIAE